MPQLFRPRTDAERYVVSVVRPNEKNGLTSPNPSKFRAITKRTFQRITTVFIALMLAFIGLLATIGTAAPAQANLIEDGFKSSFCGEGLFNYNLDEKSTFFAATTGDESTLNATPYEKYGQAGLQYTVWLGPERQEGLDKGGEYGGKSIVNFVGGRGTSDIDKIGDGVANAKSKEATQSFPGFYNSQQTCVPIVEVGASSIANLILGATGNLVMVTNLVYQTSVELSSTIITQLKEPVTKIVTTLRDAVYFEFFTVIIMISALWLAWTGLVKRSSIKAAQGAIWMLGSAVLSVALMTNPTVVPENANKLILLVSSQFLAPADSDDNALCNVEDEGDASRASVRQFQCVMWESFLYTPWVQGQFGESPKKLSEDSRLTMAWQEAQDGSIHGQPTLTSVGPVAFNKDGHSKAPDGQQNWALYHLDNKVKLPGTSNADRIEQQRALVNVAIAQLHTDDYNSAYKGDKYMDRLSMATLSGLGALGTSAFVVFVGGSIIVMDLMLMFMMIVSPLVFLAGVHPGYGRRIALSWVETIAGLVLKRILLSFLLSLVMVLYGVAFELGASSWLLGIVMLIAMTVAVFKFKGLIFKLFPTPNLGGNGSFINEDSGKPGMGKRATAGALGLATPVLGMVAGKTTGTLGGLITGKNGGAANKAVQQVQSSGAGLRPKSTNGSRPSVVTSSYKATADGSGHSAGGSEATARTSSTSPLPTVAPAPAMGESPLVEMPAEANAENYALPNNPVVTTPVMPDEKTIRSNLKEAGYKPRVGMGSVAKAAMRGAVVGATTGSTKAAVIAGVGTVSHERAQLRARNEAAVAQVSGAINAKRIEAEKAQARAKAEADRKAREQEAEARRKAQEAEREAKKQTREQEAAAKKKAQEAERKAKKQAQTVSKAKEQVAKKHGPISAPVRKTIPRPASRPTPQVPRPAPKAPQLPRPKN